ncbi:MAG: thioredoxin domain-containing protein [Candidatus Diapherotrites archaeon]
MKPDGIWGLPVSANGGRNLLISVAVAFFLYSFVFWQDYPLLDNGNAPQIGPEGAEVKVVVFVDYAFFGNVMFVRGALEPLIKEYNGRASFVFRVLPADRKCNPETDSETASCALAEALFCSREQGLYFAYANAVMDFMAAGAMSLPESARPSIVHNFSGQELDYLAVQAGLDKEKFAACIKEHNAGQEIRNNAIAGRLYYLERTPHVLVNHRVVNFRKGISINESYLLLRSAIEKELQGHA